MAFAISSGLLQMTVTNKIRHDDKSTRAHFQSDRFWNDSSGWYFSLRDKIPQGPFSSRAEAETAFSQMMPAQTSPPLVRMAIGNLGQTYHGDLASLNESYLYFKCDELIAQRCIEQNCMVCVTSILGGDLIEFEIKCHIDRIADQTITLRVQKSDPENTEKLAALIDHLDHQL